MFNNQPSIFTWKAMFVACFRSSATRVFLRAKKKAVRIWSFFTWTKSYKRGTFCGLWPNQSIFTSFNVFSPMKLWLVGYKKYLYLRLEMSEELHWSAYIFHIIIGLGISVLLGLWGWNAKWLKEKRSFSVPCGSMIHIQNDFFNGDYVMFKPVTVLGGRNAWGRVKPLSNI